MKFVLNHTAITPPESSYSDDTMTLLRFLREQQRMTGTKEGCASGDCGACTVMLGELNAHTQSIEYQTVNACILPLASVHGRHVVTVEHLNHLTDDAQPHPAQAAMVECHGSQCGFCTPGIVMSLACAYDQHNESTPLSREDIAESIGGNLCRCTGYRPILDAGVQMFSPDNTTEHATPATKTPLPLYTAHTIEQLNAIANEATLHSDAYRIPTSLAELHNCLAQAAAQGYSPKIMAGGTDLMLEVTQRYQHLSQIIDVSRVAELRELRIPESALSQDTWSIGAAVTYSELEHALTQRFPEFVRLLKRIGARQIRNRGTVGGNVANASPIGDTPPVLLMLDADIHLMNAEGNCRVVPITGFYHDYKKTELKENEVITHITFDASTLNDFHRFYKISKRWEDDISSVMAAVRFALSDDGQQIQQAYIAFGGVAATPLRVAPAEAALNGVAVNDESALNAACQALENTLTPLSDVRASQAYRKAMASQCLRKAWYSLQTTHGGDALPELHPEFSAKGAAPHA